MEEVRIDYSKFYLSQAYVRTGIFEAGTSKLIDSAFRLRSNADYEVFYLVSRSDAEAQIHNAEAIINMIEPYIESRYTKFFEEEKIMNAIFTRVSTRQFVPDKKVESKYIIKILRAAMSAPTATNQQEWEFYVTEDRDIITRLSQVTPYTTPAANAPVVIVACYNVSALRVPEMADIDMAIACENILLEAEYPGLGAVMLGIAPFEDRMQKVSEILKMPDNFRAFMIIPVGYPVNKHAQEDRYEPAKIHVV